MKTAADHSRRKSSVRIAWRARCGAIVLAAAATAIARPAVALNPVVQTLYTADPAPMVYNGTVYLYTSHDEDKSTWFTMKDWRCFSTRDMVNWTDHGSPLSLKAFGWAKSDAWAGQCIERNGRFYYYVPINRKTGGMAIGVAVADKPTGPFKDALGHPLVFDNGGDIDPTVFIDDDGQAYLYWGNPILKYVKLNKDMISYDAAIGDRGVVRMSMTVEAFGKRAKNDRPSAYEEGPWLRKRKGLYYMVYAGGPISEHIAYATSSSPIGPWMYRGVVMPTQGASFTNHPGVIDYKGHSYFFYHNGALPGGGGFTRSVCVEEFRYNPDGTFPTIDMTAEGVSALGSLDPYVRTEAETIAWESGVETEPSSQGGMAVHDIDDGDYIRVKNVDFGGKIPRTFLAGVASEKAGGSIDVRLDSPTGRQIARIEVGATGGPQRWKTLSSRVQSARGIHDLCFVFGTPNGARFKFDWWKFQ
jgi:arabinoxylan arabinofuranohydrolase